MPHIVTTCHRCYRAGFSTCGDFTRTAVATLDEESAGRIANSVFDGTVDGMDFYEIRNDLLALPDEGGAVTLPNGTVIEVRELTADDLAGLPLAIRDRGDIFEMVAAFNAAQAA